MGYMLRVTGYELRVEGLGFRVLGLVLELELGFGFKVTI